MDMAISNVNTAGPVVPAITLPGSAAGISPPQNDPSAQASQGPRPVSGEAANQLLQKVQRQLDSMNISLSFSSYGKKGDEISVIVTDRDTGKVIREIPPKEIQDLQTKLGDIIGMIFSHSV
ncbi:MAG: flagellar protein FlaG [Syntrophales bacterium]|jgi:flagellar protein FlaG